MSPYNKSVDTAPVGRWTLRRQAGSRLSPLRSASYSLRSTFLNLSLLRALKIVAATAAVLLVPPGYACADEASFTKQIADRLSRELPGLKVEIASPLTLTVNQTDGAHILQANLDRIFAFCSKAAEQCDAATSQYVAGVSGAVKDRIRPIEPSMIRLNVRPREPAPFVWTDFPRR